MCTRITTLKQEGQPAVTGQSVCCIAKICAPLWCVDKKVVVDVNGQPTPLKEATVQILQGHDLQTDYQVTVSKSPSTLAWMQTVVLKEHSASSLAYATFVYNLVYNDPNNVDPEDPNVLVPIEFGTWTYWNQPLAFEDGKLELSFSERADFPTGFVCADADPNLYDLTVSVYLSVEPLVETEPLPDSADFILGCCDLTVHGECAGGCHNLWDVSTPSSEGPDDLPETENAWLTAVEGAVDGAFQVTNPDEDTPLGWPINICPEDFDGNSIVFTITVRRIGEYACGSVVNKAILSRAVEGQDPVLPDLGDCSVTSSCAKLEVQCVDPNVECELITSCDHSFCICKRSKVIEAQPIVPPTCCIPRDLEALYFGADVDPNTWPNPNNLNLSTQISGVDFAAIYTVDELFYYIRNSRLALDPDGDCIVEGIQSLSDFLVLFLAGRNLFATLEGCNVPPEFPLSVGTILGYIQGIVTNFFTAHPDYYVEDPEVPPPTFCELSTWLNTLTPEEQEALPFPTVPTAEQFGAAEYLFEFGGGEVEGFDLCPLPEEPQEPSEPLTRSFLSMAYLAKYKTKALQAPRKRKAAVPSVKKASTGKLGQPLPPDCPDYTPARIEYTISLSNVACGCGGEYCFTVFNGSLYPFPGYAQADGFFHYELYQAVDDVKSSLLAEGNATYDAQLCVSFSFDDLDPETNSLIVVVTYPDGIYNATTGIFTENDDDPLLAGECPQAVSAVDSYPDLYLFERMQVTPCKPNPSGGLPWPAPNLVIPDGTPDYIEALIHELLVPNTSGSSHVYSGHAKLTPEQIAWLVADGNPLAFSLEFPVPDNCAKSIGVCNSVTLKVGDCNKPDGSHQSTLSDRIEMPDCCNPPAAVPVVQPSAPLTVPVKALQTKGKAAKAEVSAPKATAPAPKATTPALKVTPARRAKTVRPVFGGQVAKR